MAVLKSFLNAISTYSRIPMPFIKMEDKDIRFTMVFFPFVGVVIAGIECLWLYVSNRFMIDNLAYVIIAALIPVLVTGGIHIDGFMDCMDALHSYGDKDKKLQILSDPHIGAFCVIKLLEYAGLYIAALLLVNREYLPVVFLGFIISRILSALTVLIFDGAKENGMIHYVKKNASKGCVYILAFEILVMNIVLVYTQAIVSLIPVLLSWLSVLYYYRKSKKDYGGITGDTSGCFLCMTELIWVMAVAFYSVVLSWI